LSALVTAARRLITPGERRILGITGAPGAGKSTLAAQLVAALGEQAVLVGMDAFHLANAELDRLGRRERKGAVDTFDAAGYQNLLRRLRDRSDPVVYGAIFDRSIEESIACALPVPREVPLIITEGNYLLVDAEPWRGTADLLDECWYVDPGEQTRIDRLIARHVQFGRNLDEARSRSLGTDQRNADVIAGTRERADRIVQVSDGVTVD
jgi:pantothenate kinase